MFRGIPERPTIETDATRRGVGVVVFDRPRATALYKSKDANDLTFGEPNRSFCDFGGDRLLSVVDMFKSRK